MQNLLERRTKWAAALVLFSLFLASLSSAQEEASDSESGDATRSECFDAHRRAQELKRESQFLEAHEHLLICSSAGCPGVIIEDCGSWMSDLEQVTPSMVFQVHVDGEDAPDAHIFVDGASVEDLVSGVQVNPGKHTVRATVRGFQPLTQTVTLPAGQRMRLVRFDFESHPASPSGEDAVKMTRPTPIAVYPLLGVGVAGLASFGVLTGLGMAEQNRLEDSCSPNCTDDELSKMKTMYLIGDISVGVGAAALVTAGVLYLTRPKKQETGPQISLSIGPTRGNFGISASGKF